MALGLALLGCCLGADVTYRFEKGSLLTYNLELESKIFSDPKNVELFIPVLSRYTLRFYIMDKNSLAEALVAAAAHLDHIEVLSAPGVKKAPSKEAWKSLEEWIASFSKNDRAAFVLDSSGNLLRGRMVWPDACCYHVAKILEGISLQNRRGELPAGAGFFIANRYQGIEKNGGQDYLVFQTENNALKLRLLVDSENALPCRLDAEYAYLTLRSRFTQKLKLTLLTVSHDQAWQSFLDDEELMGAVIQAASLAELQLSEVSLLHRALESPAEHLRLAAAAYLSRLGIPPGLEFKAGPEEKETVRLNLAKAEARLSGNKEGLERLTEEGTQEVRRRAEQGLSPREESPKTEEAFVNELAGFKTPPPPAEEADIYKTARRLMAKRRTVLHFGPRTFLLRSGRYGNRLFRYNVFVPDDYDPAEDYPLLVALAGGNGFGESIFVGLKSLLPENYILVCPDAAYGMWWEPDQVRMFDDLLKRIISDYAVDADRIYLAGFSNGGVAAYLHGFTHPDQFAAVASMMGYAMSMKQGKDVETEMSLNLKNTPLLIIHGERDPVIPIGLDKILVDFLRRNDIPYKFLEVPGEGHSITFSSHYREVMDFLRKNERRNPFPRLLHLVVDDPQFNRNFWVRVEEKFKPQERAYVTAERHANTFVLKTKNVRKVSLLLSDLHYRPEEEYDVVVNKKSAFRGSWKLEPAALQESFLQEKDYARLYGVKWTWEIEP